MPFQTFAYLEICHLSPLAVGQSADRSKYTDFLPPMMELSREKDVGTGIDPPKVFATPLSKATSIY